MLADLGACQAVEDARVSLKNGDAQERVVLLRLLIAALLLHHAQLLSALQHGQHCRQHIRLL